MQEYTKIDCYPLVRKTARTNCIDAETDTWLDGKKDEILEVGVCMYVYVCSRLGLGVIVYIMACF